MESSRFLTRTLMCRDHEAMRFRYDVAARAVVGRLEVIDRDYVPFGCVDRDGSVNRNSVRRWISSRAVPMTRPAAASLASFLGLSSTEELLLSGLGLSLSDQYWLRPGGFGGRWADVSLFGRDFSTEVGQALLPHDESSAARARVRVRNDMAILSSSPDTALNGNLPKRWEMIDGEPYLVKSGKREHLMLEPYCESAATRVCERLLEPGEFVPYALLEPGNASALSACPCMVDEFHELVPAVDVIGLTRLGNSSSLYEKYLDVLERHGLSGARASLERMLVIDHLISNWDRHWGNFGVIVDSETREWVRPAPLFDMGESLWCDRAFSPTLVPYRLKYKTPFLTRPGDQMARYVMSAAWELAADASDVIDDVLDELYLSPLARAASGYLDMVERGLELRAADIASLACLGRREQFISREGHIYMPRVPDEAQER